MKIIKAKEIKPMFDNVLVTFNKLDEDAMINGVAVPKGTFLWEQKVISADENNTPFNGGEIVHLNLVRYQQLKHKPGSIKEGVIGDNPIIGYKLPIVEIDNKEYLLLESRDIDYIITKYDEIEPEKPKKNTIIMPEKKSIIL